MKSKDRDIFRLAAICIGGVILCYGIYILVDRVWNGMFADWFMEQFAAAYAQDTYWDGETVEYVMNWYGIRALLLRIIGVAGLLWILGIFLVSYYYARARVRKTITMISHEIHDFMGSVGNASDLFPQAHAEIAAQMTVLKTENQRHEQLLEAEAARKSDLITYLAHDLKTPLTSVIGYLSLLNEIPEMPLEQRAKYVNITLGKAKHLEKLINEFFDITRYNLQQVVLEKETIDLSYMLIQLTDEFYPLLRPHGNTVELDMEETVTVCGDADKLARVFNNILKNAAAYSYPDTMIKIWGEATEDEVRIFFRNRGKTIPEHRLKDIFEKFFRLDEARTTNAGGAGLGLAIAKEIVDLHGGSITAVSAEEETTFCVTLPAG